MNYLKNKNILNFSINFLYVYHIILINISAKLAALSKAARIEKKLKGQEEGSQLLVNRLSKALKSQKNTEKKLHTGWKTKFLVASDLSSINASFDPTNAAKSQT